MENIIPSVIGGLFAIFAAILAPILSDWLRRRQLGTTTGAAPKIINQAAYELAYRGTLHNLAGRRRRCRRQIRTGKAWLREAAYQHKPSSRAGWNDAIDDIRAVVIASTTISQDIHCDERFLESEIGAKLQARLGDRPVAQVLQIRRDALQSAALYQRIIQSQMRRLNMISSTVQFVGGTILFGIGALLLAMIPSAWAFLNGLSPQDIAPGLMLQIRIIYVAASLGLLVGGIVLLFTRR